MSVAKVKKLLKQVRHWAETNNQGLDDLCGMCAIASQELFLTFKRSGIKSEIVLVDSGGSGHCYVLVSIGERQYIADVTATQFCKPAIVLKKVVDTKITEWFWSTITHARTWPHTTYVEQVKVKRFKSVGAHARELRRAGWPEDQQRLF